MTDDVKRHPKALPFLFLTEMWERFGFYVVQGMLVLYMSKALGLSDNNSYTIAGAFAALAYISPLGGGLLADKLLGFRTSVIWGGFFLCGGYALLALWSNGFYLALATIIIGNGLLKPSISSLLGSLYEPGDPNRESGFTIFYVGINLGALLAGISSGYIKDHFGWHAGFALASIGLIIGLITFCFGLKRLSESKSTTVALPRVNSLTVIGILSSCGIAIYLISIFLENLQDSVLAKCLLPCVGVILLVFLLVLTLRQHAEARRNLFTLNALIISSIVYWMIYWQMFFSANLFIDRLVDKHWFGMNIPTTAFYTLESVFVILLGPAFAWSWQTLNQSSRNPSSFLKFIWAIAFVGCASLTLSVCTYFTGAHGLINPLWIVLAYFLITAGEMLLSPIGLSAVTTLAPRKLVGMMMGVWFVALGFGGEFAGWLAKLANIPEGVTDLPAQLAIYRSAFMQYAYIAFGVALLLFVMQLSLKKFYRKS
jgi:POT family proton-dependent oligopeptide transporter